MTPSNHILIIDSFGRKNQFLAEILEEADRAGYRFHLAAGRQSSYLADFFREKNWSVKKIFHAPDPLAHQLKFRAAYPFHFSLWFFRLLALKYRYQIKSLLLFGPAEKLLLGRLAKLLRLNLIWWVDVSSAYPRAKRLRNRLIRRAGNARLIAVGESGRKILVELGASADSIAVLEPAIRLHQHKFQENIFQKIAEAETLTKKFFNCGIICGLETSDQVERLEFIFGAAKLARMVAPNLQLIIIGDGEYKKKVAWLAKKMEVESIVWLVGYQNHLRKWLDSFDLYLAFPDRTLMADLQNLIRAMEAELPVVAAYGQGFEDIIDEEETGLFFDPRDSETLAGQIIRLKQDKRLMSRLAQAAKLKTEQKFDLNQAAASFINLLQP